MYTRIILLIITVALFNLAQAQDKKAKKEADAYAENVSSSITKQFSNFQNRLQADYYMDFKEHRFVKWTYENGWYMGRNGKGFRDGVGTYYFSETGTRYFGGWRKDLKEGLGVSVEKNSTYMGFFKAHKQDGFGIKLWSVENPLSTEDYSNIIKYFGEYKEGKRHGYGVLYFLDGSHISGLWINNKLTKKLEKVDVLERMGF